MSAPDATGRRRRWGMIVAQSVLFLFFGSVVNVGVAWWIAADNRPLALDAGGRGWGGDEWPVTVPDGWPERPELVLVSSSFGRRELHARAERSEYDIYFIRLVECGLPLRSMSFRHHVANNRRGVGPMLLYDDGIPFPEWLPRTGGHDELPIRPVWPGFLVNTMVYGLILWSPLAVILSIRPMLRRFRGQCPACGYPIGRLPVCTECGRPLRGKRNRA